MEVLKVSVFALISVILIVLIKQERKEMGLLLSIIATVILAIYGMLKLSDVVNLLHNMVSNSGINAKYLEIILKVVGIAYIVELTKDICIDSGETAIGTKVEMTGKVLITLMTIPIITGIIEIINKLI